MALRQIFAQFKMVVDFSVDDDEAIAVFVEYRLLSAIEIDDRKASINQRERTVIVELLIVRAAMREELSHTHQHSSPFFRIEA